MRSGLLLLVVSPIVGGIGHANHLGVLAELATLGVLISLGLLIAAGWRHLRGRTRDQVNQPDR